MADCGNNQPVAPDGGQYWSSGKPSLYLAGQRQHSTYAAHNAYNADIYRLYPATCARPPMTSRVVKETPGRGTAGTAYRLLRYIPC